MLKIEEPLKTHIEKNFLIKIENLKLMGVHHNSFDKNVIFALYYDCDKYISIETKKNVIKRVKHKYIIEEIVGAIIGAIIMAIIL